MEHVGTSLTEKGLPLRNPVILFMLIISSRQSKGRVLLFTHYSYIHMLT